MSHTVMSLYREHVALDLPDFNCMRHENKLVLYFCKRCDESGCSKCMQKKHKLHDWCDIEDIAGEKEKELARNINIVETETLPKLRRKRGNTNEDENVDKKEIDRQADAMITLINKYRENLKTRVDSIHASDGKTTDMKASLDRDIMDIEQVIGNSKKSIATQAKFEIVQGNENLKVMMTKVDKSLAEIGRQPVTCFRCGEIDAHVLQRMFGDVESGSGISSDSDDVSLTKSFKEVTINVKNTLTVGSSTVHLCTMGNRAWVNEDNAKTTVLMNAKGRTLTTNDKIDPQDLCCDATGNVYMCFPDGWISRMTPDLSVMNIVNTQPLRPHSLCVTQSGDILVALVDVPIKDFDQCEQTYIARLDSLGKEKRRIQLSDDETRLFQYCYFVEVNKNCDIVVLDKIELNQGRLYILNNKGKVKHSYNGTSKLGKDTFNPNSVCCDQQCRIIVADGSNSALHLLNERGELLKVLMTEKDGLDGPYSLGLCDGFLWIGTYEGKVIVAEYKA